MFLNLLESAHEPLLTRADLLDEPIASAQQQDLFLALLGPVADDDAWLRSAKLGLGPWIEHSR